MQIHALWHYPVKGFGGSQLDKAALTAGGYFPNDRRFALSIGGDKTANASPGTWFPKAHFLQLMSHEAMADYHGRFTSDVTKHIFKPATIVRVFRINGKTKIAMVVKLETRRRCIAGKAAVIIGHALM